MSTFRRRDARAIYELHFGPNMTPMVDVVMVILIFFMASTALLGPEVLLRATVAEERETESETPAAASPFSLGPPTLEVELDTRGGSVVVSGLGLNRAPLDALPAAATRAAERVRVDPARNRGLRAPRELEPLLIISASDGVPWEAVVRAQDVIRSAGFSRVGLR